MIGNHYRLIFPLAPALAVVALSCADFMAPSKAASESRAGTTIAEAQKPEECCRVVPSRGAQRRPYAVKFQDVSVGAVDYDAGNGVVDIGCTFDDLDAEQPVVGFSSAGLLRRIQTDNGALLEGRESFGQINPEVRVFKNARFIVRAKIPLQTKTMTMLNGAVTVLRARERSTLAWREPFGAQVGALRKSGGFDFTLTKCDISGDTATVEIACKPPVEQAAEADLWAHRQLKVALTGADKTALAVQTGTETPSVIRRVFNLDKKFPVALEISFISDLSRENLPFTLTDISVSGPNEKKGDSGSAQNF